MFLRSVVIHDVTTQMTNMDILSAVRTSILNNSVSTHLKVTGPKQAGELVFSQKNALLDSEVVLNKEFRLKHKNKINLSMTVSIENGGRNTKH